MLIFLKSKFSHAAQGVPLTPGEVALVKSVFGEEIDTSIIRKHFMSEHPEGTPADTGGSKDINFYGPKYHSSDYSQSKNLFNYGLFIHEMTHILQYQHNLVNPKWRKGYGPKGHGPYNYQLSPQFLFEDFATEQQASIIEDYAREFLSPYGASRYYSQRYYNPCHDDSCQSCLLLQKVVEDRFPEVHKTRVALKVPDSIPVSISPYPTGVHISPDAVPIPIKRLNA